MKTYLAISLEMIPMELDILTNSVEDMNEYDYAVFQPSRDQ